MCAPTLYDRRLPLFWALDFNVDPMCSVIGQRDDEMVYILDELVLPDSNTLAACEEFLKRAESWVCNSNLPIQLKLYGDAAGQAQSSSASRTDWQIVREFFERYRHYCQTSFLVGSSNPLVKDRTNCVNARLLNQAGLRRLFIDPRCKKLIQDLEHLEPAISELSLVESTDRSVRHGGSA